MWPSLFGPGWVQQLLMTIGMIGVFVATLRVVLSSVARPREVVPDEIQMLWHQYEVGDLTQWEFERRRRGIIS